MFTQDPEKDEKLTSHNNLFHCSESIDQIYLEHQKLLVKSTLMKTVIQSFLLNEMKHSTWLTQTFFEQLFLKLTMTLFAFRTMKIKKKKKMIILKTY